MYIAPSPTRRQIVLDIQTVTENQTDSVPKRRVVCISILIDEGNNVRQHSFIATDEFQLLRDFWAQVKPFDVFIGCNNLEPDLSFVRERTWAQGMSPALAADLPRYYSHDLVDLNQLWPRLAGNPTPVLDRIVKVLGMRRKQERAAKISAWWRSDDFDVISASCGAEIRCIYRAFHFLTRIPMPEYYSADELIASENFERIVHSRD